MTTVAGTRTSADLLYLAIDLGSRPTFARFSEQVNALGALQRYCLELPDEPTSPGEATPVKGEYPYDVPRSSDDPPKSAYPYEPQEPSGGFVARRREIRIVRTSMASPWVTVLVEIAENSPPIAYGAGALFGLQRLMRMAMEWQTHRQGLSERRRAAERLDRQEATQLLGRHSTASSVAMTPPAIDGLTKLDPVLAAELVSPDDPRVTVE